MRSFAVLSVLSSALCGAAVFAADSLPFTQRVEVYRDKEGDIAAFTVHLEQPFLAEEFEKSNYLRLNSDDDRAYLIYPKETTFQEKHAEFYGRLRGKGEVKLRLSYEIVSENPDGSRRVELRQGRIAVPIPAAETGPRTIYQAWARQQNVYFAGLLRYYPEESFYRYCLLQSQARYGVLPPPLPVPPIDRSKLETNLYQVLTGSYAIQEALQREILSGGSLPGELSMHISQLSPPALKSLPYKELLEKSGPPRRSSPRWPMSRPWSPRTSTCCRSTRCGRWASSWTCSTQWGGSLLRLCTVHAIDQRLEQKLEDQLCLRRDVLTRLFGDAVIGELAVTGADPFVNEGTDVTMIFRVKQPAAFRAAAAGWLAAARRARPDLTEAEFNYRGHKVARALHRRPHGQLVRGRARRLCHLLELAPGHPPGDRRGRRGCARPARGPGLPLRVHDPAPVGRLELLLFLHSRGDDPPYGRAGLEDLGEAAAPVLQQPGDAQQRLALLPPGVRPLAGLARRTG